MAVSIPKLYHFSESDHILAIEDLGKLRDLDQWLQLPLDLHRVRDVGARLGTFVGRLHSADASQVSSHESFSNSIGHDLVKAAIVDTLIKYLDLSVSKGENACMKLWQRLISRALLGRNHRGCAFSR